MAPIGAPHGRVEVVSTDAKLDGDDSRRTGGAGGPWLFEMPYTATAQRLTNPDLGLPTLVARAGAGAGYSIDVTLLDAPDHRLTRSGLLLAHRMVDGVGEWYLSGPRWVPQLASEQVEPMGQTDLPDRFADLVRPFRRNSTLGPVAALTCERSEFAFRDLDGMTLARLRDDRVTVRRGGLTTARFREVTLSPHDRGLSDAQREWLQSALVAAGGTRVIDFPPLVSRLGAPATGLTDFPQPEPQPWDRGASFESFVSALLETRLREIVQADLSVRGGQPDAVVRLIDRVLALRCELRGISPVLDPDWIEQLDAELHWVGELPAGQPEMIKGAEIILTRLRGERYLNLLDWLVTASRAPKLGNSSTVPAAEVATTLLDNAVARLIKTAKRLQVDSSQQSWEAAAWAGRQLQDVCRAAALVIPGRAKKISRRVDELITKIVASSSQLPGSLAADADSSVSEVTVAEAFQRGRQFERAVREQLTAREEVVSRWPQVAKKLR